MTKVCVKCGIEKDVSLFSKGRQYKDGVRGTCKRCHTDYVMEYYKKNPDKKAEKVRMNTYYKPNWKRHNLTEEAYKELVAKYEGTCHSCRDRKASHIDHDHECCDKAFSCGNCVRGVLCSQCNTALGLLAEDPEKVQRLLDYVS